MDMEQKWEMYKGQADKALAQAKYDHAESLLYAALGIAEDFPNNDQRLTITLEALGELLFRTGQYQKAEPVCLKTLELYEQTLGATHPDVGILANNLAMLYHLQEKYEEAEKLYKKALNVQTKALGAKHPEVVNLLGNYANLLFRMHRLEEAEHMRAMAHSATTGKWNRSGRYQAFQRSSARDESTVTPPPQPAPLNQPPQAPPMPAAAPPAPAYQAPPAQTQPAADPRYMSQSGFAKFPTGPAEQQSGGWPQPAPPTPGGEAGVVPADDEFRVTDETSGLSRLMKQRKQT